MSRCTNPKRAFWHGPRSEPDARQLIFKRRSILDEAIELPCGKCFICKHALGIAWGHRIWHECQRHDVSCFLTLTYSDENRPAKLDARHIELFWKKLRKWCAKRELGRVQYFLVGEYGDRTGHAHYHLVLFGMDLFQFAKRTGFTGADQDKYLCPEVEALWGHGTVDLRPVNPARAMYAAMHQVKAFGADEKPFRRCSIKPAIGAGWLREYHDDFLRLGFGTVDGVRYAVPLHYLAWKQYRDIFEPLRKRRQEYARDNPVRTTKRQREARELNLRAKLALRQGAKYSV